MTAEARINKISGRMREEIQPTERRLAFDACGDVIWQSDDLIGTAENKLTWVQDEWLVRCHLDGASQIVLFLRWIDELILVVLESSEEAIKPNVNRSRLHHGSVVGLKLDASKGDFGLDIAI